MKRGITSLAVIASVAPFVGFFGTVIGIVDSFTGVSGEKSADLAFLAGNLSESLVPTEWGLLTALLAYFGHTYLSAKLEDFDLEMESATVELINQLVGCP